MDVFERERPRLVRMAARMLGSAAEAEEAVQEAGLRLLRQDAVEEPAAWLTTTVARLCLDALRRRKVRGVVLPVEAAGEVPDGAPSAQEAVELAEGIGLALLVVLDRLGPEERVAFVLHDVLETPFGEVGRILGKSEQAVRQMASRARRRVRGAPVPERQRSEEMRLVAAFHAASAAGDVGGLLAVLAPDVLLQTDGLEPVIGAEAVSGRARVGAGARGWVAEALVDGAPGLIVAPRGRLLLAIRFGFAGGRIARIEVIREPARVAELDLAVA